MQMSSEIKLLERTKACYGFNSKGDNWNVNQLLDTVKISPYVKDTMSGSNFIGNRFPLKKRVQILGSLGVCEERLILCF